MVVGGQVELGATWPRAGADLISELQQARGRIALIRDEGPLVETISLLAEAVGEQPTPVGQVFSDCAEPPGATEAFSLLHGRRLLTDLDVLFWPELHVDPVGLLRRLAANGPIIAVWPGKVADGRAMYSEPARRDYFDAALRDALVLTPVPVTFPDDVPYEVERISA